MYCFRSVFHSAIATLLCGLMVVSIIHALENVTLPYLRATSCTYISLLQIFGTTTKVFDMEGGVLVISASPQWYTYPMRATGTLTPCMVHGVTVPVALRVKDGREKPFIVMLLFLMWVGCAALSRANIPEFLSDPFS